jgi:protein TonB
VVIEEPKIEEATRYAEEMPLYPGGEGAMYSDIYNSITYPEMEKELNIQGKVYVDFVVEKDGSVTEVAAVREVKGGPNLSKEAVKAVKKLKKFTPAKMNGKPVRLRMTIPIQFTLK